MRVWREGCRRFLAVLALLFGTTIAPQSSAQTVTEAPTATPRPGQVAEPTAGAPGSQSDNASGKSAADGGPVPELLAEAEKLLAPRPVVPPADPVAAAAYAVLEKHCARCHQGGKLVLPAPAAGLGNILHLDEIAGEPSLVHPGNPDASRLYVMMLRRQMPIDVPVTPDDTPRSLPSAQEIDTVRKWIAGLSPNPKCRDRRFISQGDIDEALVRTAKEAGDGAQRVRLISIAHLHNACASFRELAAYRQAIVKLVNSLSWRPWPIAVTAVDEARTLFRIDLGDLGWLPEHWERIMRSGTDPMGLLPSPSTAARKPFGTEVPLARADWLARTVLQAPLYYDVLGLPGTGPEILKILQVDMGRARLSGAIDREMVLRSRFSIQPSLVERLSGRTGPLWSAYHVIAGEAGEEPAFLRNGDGAVTIPHHASRMMFTLPNGLNAFAIIGQRGDRLDELPPDIARRSTTPEAGVHAGLSCFSCHGSGQARIAGNDASPVALAIAEDSRKVAAAQRRAGLLPDGALDGVEPLTALALAYERPLSIERAAAELWVEIDALLAISDRGDSAAAVLARRLGQGIVSRAEIEASADVLARAVREGGSNGGIGAGQTTGAAADGVNMELAAIDNGPTVVLYSDKVRYKQGDPLNLVVKTSSDCHLTLISVDQIGRGTVIFPSDFETNSLLTAGQVLRLPGPNAPYSFRLKDQGREHIVGLCNEASTLTDGIIYDFERQRFADLGDYAAHLMRHATGIAAVADTANENRSERRIRRRRRQAEPTGQPARPEEITRTAITIVVE